MQTIAWDVDDVLNDLMRVWFEQEWLPKHPACIMRYHAITENPPDKLLGIRMEDYLDSLDRFRLSHTVRLLDPVPEVLDWFRQYGHHFRHIALSATPLKSAHILADWVINHYGNWIRSFNFVPSARENHSVIMYDSTKADYLQWWGKVDVLIDDTLIHIEAARQLGIKTLIMPRPWNKSHHTVSDMLNTLTKFTN